MFTGLIEETGTVQAVREFDGGLVFEIAADKVMSDLGIDDSIAVNGCCQTVVKVEGPVFTVQSIKETLDKTNFGLMHVGQTVNLERPLTPSARLGGHFVQGHINGTGTVCHLSNRGENWYVGIQLSPELYRYSIREGSIAIDGISLTLADLDPEKQQVFVSIIPHTWQVTNMSGYQLGQVVNIEVDMLAKLVFNFMDQWQLNSQTASAQPANVQPSAKQEETLKQQGGQND